MKEQTDKKKIKCNICNLPGPVTYKEVDEDTGKIEEKTHNVGCLGHEHLHPSVWNFHPAVKPSYDDYRKFYARMRKVSQ